LSESSGAAVAVDLAPQPRDARVVQPEDLVEIEFGIMVVMMVPNS